MTTQDQHTETEASQAQTDSMSQAQDESSPEARVESPMEQTQPFTPPTEAPIEGAESPTEKSLFDDALLGGLRARWDDVQASFVDDPRKCVQQADGLVADVVDKLVNGFAEARSRLEEQWARGEDASTEDLRVALKRYREFFQRLLTV
jgi:hypothetical protein